MSAFSVYSQTSQISESFKLHFSLDGSVLDSNFRGNSQQLQRLSDLYHQAAINEYTSIHKIKINSYASPEGGRIYNEKLTHKRTRAISDYLTKTISVPDSLIEELYSGIDWEGLYDLVKASDMAYRDQVLDIIENTPEETWSKVNSDDRWMTLVDSRLKRLKDLRYGRPYCYMSKEFFAQLRVGSVVTIYLKTISKPIIDEIVEKSPIVDETQLENRLDERIAQISVEDSDAKKKKSPQFAVKTNLLYDALLIPSIELEVPIGNRLSVAAEWLFPWWVLDNGTETSSRCRLQILNGNIEGKYWFGDRSSRANLTGWYCGLYSGAGIYDVEYKAKGYQGEFFIAAGVSGGYAHTINRSGSLRMEYSLGVGYAKTEYRHYEAVWGSDNVWHPVRDLNGTYTWFGPTRARVSLVWMIGNKTKRGDGRG